MATIPVGYQMTPGGIKPIPGGIADPNRANDPTLKLDKTTDKGSVFVGERDSTGQRNEVFIRGNQVTTPPPITKLEEKVNNAVFKSDREEAQARLTGKVGETGDVAKEYGISTEGFPTTFQGQVDLLKAQSADQKTEAQRRLEFDFQRQQQEVGDFKKAGETTVESVIASLAQGREGAVSSSAQQAISKFSADMQEQIGRAISGLEEAQARKNYALRELDRAEAAGNFDLAEQIKGQIALAESEIRTERTNVLNAQAQAVDTALKVDQNLRQNMASFTGVLDSGVQLTAEGALGLAKQFNIPSEIALDYFTATEQIRNDKKLDQTAKEIALDQADFNFQNAVTGKALEQANKVKYYEEQVRNGADPETLAVMLDIPNEYNPVYKADLALKKAQAEIERAEANGQPVGWKERQEYMQYLADKQYATGQVDVVLPSKAGRFGITPTAGGILVDVMEGDKPDIISTVRDEGQCGAFVNDTLGTALGDSFKEKMAKTDPYAMPKPGMFFVQQTAAQWGHCGIVESINEDGTLNIVEANYGEPGTVGRRYNVPVTDFAGFGTPPNAKVSTTGTSNLNVDKLIRQAGTLVSTKFGKEQIQDDIKAYAQQGDLPGLQDYIRSVAFSDLGAEEQKARRVRASIDFQGDQMKKLIDEYTAAGGDLGIFAGTKTKIGKKINKIDDPKRLELAQRMLIMVEDFARAQTGAAIQDFERKNFEEILPNIFDSGELAKSKIDAFKGYVKDLDESDLRFRLGDTMYEEIYGGVEEEVLDPENIVNSWMQKSTTNNLYDEYGLN